MDSIILCYSRDDEIFARDLAEYLEINLPLEVSLNEAVVGPALDLMEAAEVALSAEVALILLSPFSVPKGWKRKTWETVFFERPKQFQTHLGFVLVSDCAFPAVFRRERFFDASRDSLAAAREIKRWLLQPLNTAGPASRIAPELEEVRRSVADRPGSAAGIAAGIAVQFAHECAADFEAVYRFDCRGRSRAGIAGDIGAALGLSWSGSMEENLAALQEWCAGHRVLFILAGVNAEDREFATPGGRASVIFTEHGLPGSIPSAAADAVRKFEETLRIDVEAGLRLGWTAVNLLKAQGRSIEVLEVLDTMDRIARNRNDTSAMLRIQREQFWNGKGQILEGPHRGFQDVMPGEQQLILPFTG